MKIWLKQIWCGLRKYHDWGVIKTQLRPIECFRIWECSKCGKRNKEKI